MSNEKFMTKTRVALKNGNESLPKGTVVGETAGGLILVEWDGAYVNSHQSENLCLELEAYALEQEAKELAAQRKRELEVVREQIAAKMQASADALREAAELAQNADSYLQDFYNEVRPLLRAMDEAGWSTSSLSC